MRGDALDCEMALRGEVVVVAERTDDVVRGLDVVRTLFALRALVAVRVGAVFTDGAVGGRTDCLGDAIFCMVAVRVTEFSPRTAASAGPTPKNSVTKSNMIPFITVIVFYQKIS